MVCFLTEFVALPEHGVMETLESENLTNDTVEREIERRRKRKRERERRRKRKRESWCTNLYQNTISKE